MISFASQVNRYSLFSKWSTFFKSHDDPMKVLYPIRNRGLVKVSGPEAAVFLQGLITNDMNHFDEGAKSMYAMFLNNKGRVLYDTLVHKWGSETDNVFMLECDKSIQKLLQQHLKIYKLKRDVKVAEVTDLYKLWAFVAPPEFDLSETVAEHKISAFKDPRLADLGYRLITSPEMGQIDVREAIGRDAIIKNNEEEYRSLRYRLGVSEGAEDLYPGTCFPLEANCDYLHGVSFHKGCYIGQELTARVHHTGVVRKRIMPLKLVNIEKKEELTKDATIWATTEKGRTNLGKFKAYAGNYGIGLVRIKEALAASSVNIGTNIGEIVKPHWWPIEAPKEKLTTLKAENEASGN
ncbi:hypothetical protein PYW07_008016 [Mythimna separata]|uniref:Aminomethyltransferase folate-binding domain-containing protein n=1 Tax=Mythimna separata TaxID=271217 RepID=A0AAD8DUC7_MYTSE|nr:hypothetical protein PYW07_008016 [Mythimna separata]